MHRHKDIGNEYDGVPKRLARKFHRMMMLSKVKIDVFLVKWDGPAAAALLLLSGNARIKVDPKTRSYDKATLFVDERWKGKRMSTKKRPGPITSSQTRSIGGWMSEFCLMKLLLFL
jgi:hypothetical protein